MRILDIYRRLKIYIGTITRRVVVNVKSTWRWLLLWRIFLEAFCLSYLDFSNFSAVTWKHCCQLLLNTLKPLETAKVSKSKHKFRYMVLVLKIYDLQITFETRAFDFHNYLFPKKFIFFFFTCEIVCNTLAIFGTC